MTFGQSETSHVSTMWGHWWETTDMPPNPQANDVFIHRTAMWRPLITPCLETRSLGNRRCFFPPPPSAFFHIFSSFILFWTYWFLLPLVQVTVRRQPLSHFFIQNKKTGALSDDSSDAQIYKRVFPLLWLLCDRSSSTVWSQHREKPGLPSIQTERARQIQATTERTYSAAIRRHAAFINHTLMIKAWKWQETLWIKLGEMLPIWNVTLWMMKSQGTFAFVCSISTFCAGKDKKFAIM